MADDLFKPRIRWEKKSSLNEFEHGMIVDFRHAVLNIYETAWIFPQSLLFTENGQEKRKCAVSSRSLGKKTLLIPEIQGEWPASDSLKYSSRCC